MIRKGESPFGRGRLEAGSDGFLYKDGKKLTIRF